MSRQFFTSDFHLFHGLVMSLRGFDSPDEQMESIRSIWCARVRKQDAVHIVGDLCLSRLDAATSFIESLPGTKHLYFGNHDAGHPAHSKARGVQARYAPTFASVSAFGQVSYAGETLLVNHLPYDDSNDVRPGLTGRYGQWRFKDMGMPLVHGHTHTKSVFTRSDLGSPQIHIGIDAFPEFATSDDILDVLRSSA